MPIEKDENKIRALLADGRISMITVDTSIFDEKHLQLNSATLQALAGLKSEKFTFVLSGTVYAEVLAHLTKASEDAIRTAKKAIGQALNAFETRAPTRDELLKQISGGRSAERSADERLKRYIFDVGCEVLEDAELVSVQAVLDGYFKGQPPFGAGKKKAEFPDAFALHALERKARDRRSGILVVSKDGDWNAFCAKSDRLYAVPEIERALGLVTDAPLGLRKAVYAWIVENEEGRIQVRQRIAQNVQEIDFTATGDAEHGQLEAFAWSGDLSDVVWPEETDIDVIEVSCSEHGGAITVVASLPLDLAVKVPVELSFSFWDDVDRESVGMGGYPVEVDEHLQVAATVTLEIKGSGTENERFECLDSELDPQHFQVDVGEVDCFELDDWREREL